MWISPLHIVVFTVLAYLEIGPAAILGSVLLVLVILLQIGLARMYTRLRYCSYEQGIPIANRCYYYYYSSLRFKAARITDSRIKVMNEVITGIRVIKMYAWEYAFKKMVDEIRK